MAILTWTPQIEARLEYQVRLRRLIERENDRCAHLDAEICSSLERREPRESRNELFSELRSHQERISHYRSYLSAVAGSWHR